MDVISRPWQPQDLIDDLQLMIDEEPDQYLNAKRATLCMARDYLKAYFDTGLMPEDLQSDADIDRVHCIKLLKADAEGRVVVLPCKLGDKVYSKDGKAAEIEEFFVGKRSIVAQVSFKCDYNCEHCAFDSWRTDWTGESSCDGEYGAAMVTVEEIGEAVFLTREEAEAALAKLVGDRE